MTKSLDFLIEQRSEDNDILDSNEYVFARQNSESHLRGSDCLRKYAAASGARKPETLTSTYLRKHVATMSQIMNLKENELDQLAKFMGHDIRVHREYYRLTENTLQLAKISKLLMAIELGTEAYKGKSLDEIDLGLEIPPSSEVGAVQESQVSGNDLEIFNERSFEDSDEEVNILTQKSVTRRPLDEKKRTEKTGKRQKRVSEPAEDSDEEIDVLTQNTVTGRPSDEMKKSEKRGKRRKRVSEPVEDSDEEIDVLTQNTVTGRPSDKMKKSEKRGKRRKRVSEPVEDSDEEIDVLTQNTVTGRPSDEMKKSEKTGLNPQFRKKKKCHRRPWSSEEKAAVWRQLGRYITLQRVPGKELCVKAIEAEQMAELGYAKTRLLTE
ncbi:uncharacterized protein LOC125903907 [Epinephelus fuscoguttatus]|uniref:uncharacterized protein LOC125903907 n=1 Tax=Epinephelus fuscoguttatus TaxID=293821 RepID=UPI0020D1216D|nr:uncharacterized protein LOC125903907 [Epinephelus fuscoguttatus]